MSTPCFPVQSNDEGSSDDVEVVKGASLALNPPEGKSVARFHVSDFLTCTEPMYYTQKEHEFDEHADFQVIGETDPTEDVDSDEEDGVPIRVLTDFAIYEETTQRLVPIADLLLVNHGIAGSYVASGYIKAWIDDDQLDDSDENAEEEEEEDHASQLHDDLSQRVRLSRIKKFTLHDMKKEVRGLDRYGAYHR